MLKITIRFNSAQNKMEENNKKSEILIVIILVKLSILCALKLFKMCSKIYKKHNEVVLKKNFKQYIDTEKGNQASTSEQNREQHS